MTNFTADKLTQQATTNAKGEAIKLGDLVITKGSKIVRVVQGIGGAGNASTFVRGVRADGKHVSHSVWMDASKLTVVGSVL